MHAKILLVEDEDQIRMTVGDRLRSEGYSVECAIDGDDGFHRAMAAPYDLIILDVMLPGRDGFVLCDDLRKAGLPTPILMLTSCNQTVNKVRGLKTGADDYVTKPFQMAELMARIEALLRRKDGPTARVAGHSSGLPPSAVDRFGSIEIDRRGTSVTRDGNIVNISAREFELLEYFTARPGTTVSREELLTQVWRYNAATSTRTVDVHVASLRQKLETDPRQPRYIVTVQRLGYKFVP
jgi:two-component system alkaline phosphatase synthesis response regulator PhoP